MPLSARSYAVPFAAAVVLAAAPVACAAPADHGEGDKGAGKSGQDAFTIKDPRIGESSGLAASHRHKNIYWTHNDSDDGPRVYAVDATTGKTVATVTMNGVDPRDVEAISIGADGDIYVGDIGDNLGGKWPEVWIYRFPEPSRLHDTTVTPTRYTVRYADGPRDAEAMMVHPKTGRVYIASKSDENKGAVYAGPPHLSPSGVNTFRRIARTSVWVTDGAFSPDGTRLVLRGYFSGREYRWHDGAPSVLGGVSVPFQQQGESVTFTPDGRTLMYGSEGDRSEVQPVELDGKQLPENVAAEDRKKGDRAQGDGGKGGSDGGGGGERDDRKVALGGVTFLVAVGVWLGLRRVFRRRG